jgi:hypothetical protein
MRDEPSRDLTNAEAQYASEVRWAIRGLPSSIRTPMLQTLRQNLFERPPCDSRPQLERELGTPAAYAAELQHEADHAVRGGVAGARRRQRIHRILTAAAVVAVAAAVVLVGRWWLTWDPGLRAPLGGVCATTDGPGCGQEGFVDVALADALEVPCKPGGDLFLTAGLAADTAVTVTGASIPGVPSADDPMMSDQFVWLEGVQVWKRPDQAQAATPSTWPVTVGPDGMLPELHFHLVLCRSGQHLPGAGQTIEQIEVRYHALGRDRTAVIPLPRKLAVMVPPFD